MQDLKMYMFLFSEQEANSEESLKKRPKVDKSGEEKLSEMGERDHGAEGKDSMECHSPGTLFFCLFELCKISNLCKVVDTKKLLFGCMKTFSYIIISIRLF